MAEENPHLAGAKDAIERLRAVDDAQKAKRTEQAKILDEQLIALNAVNVYGPAGARAHILDTVTPFLNDRTAHYLGSLSDGNISAVWNTISTTKSGEMREKFKIEVTNNTGGDSFAALSGGEKRKARLACALALQDLVASRASKPINLWMGDEIDEALDPAGLERLMTVLEEKARERGTVLVISHNDLKDWIRSRWLVVKDAGAATVAVE